MKKVEQPQALIQLRRTKQSFSKYIARNYASKAVDCAKCNTICCIDHDFVNVNITRLEAEAIWRTLKNSPRISNELFEAIKARAAEAVKKYKLSPFGDTFSQTYACPLFEIGIGCTVHWKAKPAPCIQHGCYENWQDLPDTKEFARVEKRVEHLNKLLYGNSSEWDYATIPVWLCQIAAEEAKEVDCRERKEDNSLEFEV
jgi:hypothetical protein